MKTVLLEESHPVHLKKTFLAMIEGSVGSNQYCFLYIDHPDGPKDVIFDGDLACAFYVSSILTLCNLIAGGVHTTVDETIKDLIQSGWTASLKPCAGAIVIWSLKLSDSDKAMHRHIGICTDKRFAVSTKPALRSPQKHGIWSLKTHTGQKREVEGYYIHPDLHF